MRSENLGSVEVFGPYVRLEPGQLEPCVPKGLEEAYLQFQEWLEEFSGEFTKVGIAISLP
jgi:hypothetical protein